MDWATWLVPAGSVLTLFGVSARWALKIDRSFTMQQVVNKLLVERLEAEQRLSDARFAYLEERLQDRAQPVALKTPRRQNDPRRTSS